MNLRLQELQVKEKHTCKLKAEQLVKGEWQDINGILHHQSLFYIPKMIWTEFISKDFDNILPGHFSIKKIHELIAQKYYWPSLCHNVQDYMKECNVYLVLKTVRHKFYGNF